MKLTTLIPAFKIRFLPELLMSLKCQSVKPGKIIVSDDSENNDFIRAAEDGQYAGLTTGLNIEWVEGPKRGHYANFRSLVSRLPPEATLFHILCDDDILYPGFYRQHLRAHSRSKVTSTFSRRWIAAENGQPVSSPPFPAPLESSNDKLLQVESGYLFRSTLPYCRNWLGEFSNSVFRREAGPLFLEPRLDGIFHYGLYDLGTFLKSAGDRGVVVINEHLGAFRRSRFQHSSQKQSPTIRLSYTAWIALSISAFRLGKISKDQLFSCATTTFGVLRNHYPDDPKAAKIIGLEECVRQRNAGAFINGFLSAWPSFYEHIDPSIL